MIAGGGGGIDGSADNGFGGGLTGGDYDYNKYSGGNQTHPGIYYREYTGTLSGRFGYGFSVKDLEGRSYAGGGGGLYGWAYGGGGSGFVYSENRLATEIMDLPTTIKVENPEIRWARNIGQGYAIITTLSSSECKCVQKCFCSKERFILKNFHAIPFMYSY